MTTPRSLDNTVSVETPEQVVFSYSLAGIGSRSLAAFIDFMLCILTLIGVIILLSLVLGGGVWRSAGAAMAAWGAAVLVIAQFAVVWGYYVLFEGLNDGRTPGKKWLGLRVVQDGGFSVSFAASAIRNLARIIDLQPGIFSAIGLISIAASKQGKRTGDMLAGTIVVRERVARVTLVAAAPRAAPGAAAQAPLQTLLTDDEYSVLSRFVERRSLLDADRRATLSAQLAQRFRAQAPQFGGNDAAFIVSLHEHEQAARTRGVAARSDTGAAREQHALVAAGAERWLKFSTRLSDVQGRGLANLREAEVSQFVAEYREMATDLARLQTASRGREVDAVFTLSRLVAAAHNLVYRQRSLSFGMVFDYLTVTVPAEIRGSVRPILLAALLMFGPAAVSWISVARHPDLAADLLPPGMLDRAENGVARAKGGEGYIPDPQLMRPVMASRIVANNVQVTFAAFAFGATAGIGTMLLLLFNGVSFGAALGLYQSKGILTLILAFVAPHSVLELGAICIAGGGGLLIGAGFLLPGARTRREAIVANSQRAIRLIAGSTLFLVIAGTIEGFVSPIPWWPLSWKVAVTAVTAMFFFGFILLAPRPAVVTAPPEP